jgi:hypothetical protein
MFPSSTCFEFSILLAPCIHFIYLLLMFVEQLLFNFAENMTPEQRRENYLCDITYVTNSELGFDYLRDNLAMVDPFHCGQCLSMCDCACLPIKF